ncbi:MAG: GTP 3',8-cyclase MoaA [Caldimicrobium sp.]|nr:GTP 3',8-cyclase MoaA [Caldimicrobium sp.]MDW8182521.1 GTP 3',8-cyclase MoaA [Caldimicrobium sp.]
MLIDRFGRSIEYLRISVTDRCNFRCIYCESRGPLQRLSARDILTYEEILEIVETAVGLGVKRVRITGGEPLFRRNIEDLIEKLSSIEGLCDLSLTTNGYLLLEKAEVLKKSGLKRLNVSLDTMDPKKFAKLTGGFDFKKVWDGLLLAEKLGFTPLKINVVVIKGVNDDEILDLAKLTLEHPWEIRFIEYMPIGNSGRWKREDVIWIEEVKGTVEKLYPLRPSSSIGGGPAKVFQWMGAIGKIGFISPLSEHFCSSCNRLRITADGKLRACLFSDQEIDLKAYLREKKGSLEEAFSLALKVKPEVRNLQATRRAMRAIGG